MGKPENSFYEFGPFRLDTLKRLLLRDGEVVPLPPKAFDTLLALIKNSDRVVEKTELMDAVWPDSFVEEANLTQNVSILRKALGERAGEHRYIVTVPGRGYRFVASVGQSTDQVTDLILERHALTRIVTTGEDTIAPDEALVRQTAAGETLPQNTGRANAVLRMNPARLILYGLIVSIPVAVIYALVWRALPRPQDALQVKSIAVLPFKSLSAEGDDRYLGLGMADTLITRLSNIKQLIVRPTSAVRKYGDENQDPIAAGREQGVEAVLEGSIQKSGGRMRVTARLISVRDGASLWAGSFDEKDEDIFRLQDSIVKRLAGALAPSLTGEEQRTLTKRHTSSPEAYDYYAKAMYHFFNIQPNLKTRPESDLAVDLFKEAIELDPEYALAHAHLGYTYVKTAVFQEDSPALVEAAKQELAIAERLDPQLAEVHAARYFIAFSQYEGWHIETAIRELRLAQQLDPNVGHSELADLYFHIGLEEQGIAEYELALKVDPNNDQIKSAYVDHLYQSAKPDEALAASQRFFNRGPDHRYYMEKMMAKEAAALIEEEYQKDPDREWIRGIRALLFALQGKHKEAEATALEKVRRYRGYHHHTYNVARIYALAGKSGQALKWLRVTVKEGFPCYPLFARDRFLDPIRNDPAFIQFMWEMKQRWEGYRRELG